MTDGSSPSGSAWREMRHDAADGLGKLSVIVLCLVFALLAFIWMLAAVSGQIPSGPWGEYAGNHGPWHGRLGPAPTYVLGHLLLIVLLSPLIAAAYGLLSFVLRPSVRAAVLVPAATATFFALFLTHAWLID